MRFLFITPKGAKDKSLSTGYLKEACEEREIEFDVVAPSQFRTIITNRTDGRDILTLDGDKVYGTTYDAIIPRLGTGLKFASHLLRFIEANKNVPCLSTGKALLNASSKAETHRLLSNSRVRTPQTSIINDVKQFKGAVEDIGGFPENGCIIVKADTGSQGNNVFPIFSAKDADNIIELILRNYPMILVQEAIETDPEWSNPEAQERRSRDIRAYVVGDKVEAAYMRLSKVDEKKANYSISKQGIPVTLTEEETELAINAAKAVGLLVAGVDIMRDEPDGGKPYVCEVNGNASLAGITKITKKDVAGAIIDFCVKRVKKEKSENKAQVLNVQYTNTHKGLSQNEENFIDYDELNEFEIAYNLPKGLVNYNDISKDTANFFENREAKAPAPAKGILAQAKKKVSDFFSTGETVNQDKPQSNKAGLFVPNWKNERAKRENQYLWKSIGGNELKADFSNATKIKTVQSHQENALYQSITNLPAFFFMNLEALEYEAKNKK